MMMRFEMVRWIKCSGAGFLFLAGCEPLGPANAGLDESPAPSQSVGEKLEDGSWSPAPNEPVAEDLDDGSWNPSLDEVWILAAGLGSLDAPAVGNSGVSYREYLSSGQMAVTFADWSGVLTPWYQDAPGYFAAPAAHAERHLALLYRPNEYGIYERGEAKELSMSIATYKESLAASASGFGWMDYGELGADGLPVALTAVVFQPWVGAQQVLTDDTRYRTQLVASETHLAYVEYPDSSEASSGQIMVANLDGSAVFPVASSPSHQDHPAIDGDWVVWQEFVSPTATVIRAANLSTMIVRDLTDKSAFRTGPDVRGDLVIWEDHRSGNGDIYSIDLSEELPAAEHLIVGESTHSTGARLIDGGLVWLEVDSEQIELRRGRWAVSP